MKACRALRWRTMITFHKISVFHPIITRENSLGTKFLVRQQVYVIARGGYDRCDIGGFDPGVLFLPLYSSGIGDAGGSAEFGVQSTGRHSCRPDVRGLAAAIGVVAGMTAAPIVYLDPDVIERHSGN
jgi:hypothetical protein